MEYNAVNTLTIQLEDAEIESFLNIIKLVKDDSKKLGFKKKLSSGSQTLIDEMFEKFIGDEEDTN